MMPQPRSAAAIALFVLGITVGPLVWQLLASLKSTSEDVFGANASLLPHHPTLRAYREVFSQVPVATYIRNSLTVVVLSIVSQLVFSTTAGYMLSKPGWKGRKAVWVVLVASMMFPFESIMVSLFLSIRDLGLVDNLAGVWLPGFVGAINVLLMRGAFLAVTREIEDSAMLDAAKAMDLRIAREGFIDRAYEPDGTLRSRKLPGAVHTDPKVAAAQAVGFIREGGVRAHDGTFIRLEVETLCFHGDTPGAPTIAAAVRDALEREGIEVRPPAWQ